MNKGDDDQNQGRQIYKFPYIDVYIFANFSISYLRPNRAVAYRIIIHISSKFRRDIKIHKFGNVCSLGLAHLPYHFYINIRPLNSTPIRMH